LRLVRYVHDFGDAADQHPDGVLEGDTVQRLVAGVEHQDPVTRSMTPCLLFVAVPVSAVRLLLGFYAPRCGTADFRIEKATVNVKKRFGLRSRVPCPFAKRNPSSTPPCRMSDAGNSVPLTLRARRLRGPHL
jgi:hypothetical protein